MYTVTFYSFKGGVGRTMSLVNVAVQLAKGGKKILMVDFDLEAPGLSSFKWSKPNYESKGLVEYVTDYRASLIAPDFLEYVSLTEKYDGGGEIWTMPAGRDDADYSTRLNTIDWHRLYDAEEGYVFFEDLKRQWQSTLCPDYVFIDSRTGHSDVEGICTRQLPDAVCLLFFPNEQNLQGLRKVAKAVQLQNEARKGTKTSIVLHFVAANVPDMDDEDGIVGKTLEGFQKELGYKALAAKIQHYNSLSLLNQEIFSLARPKSRLTKEYGRLAAAIVRENLSDRAAAITLLQKTLEATKRANAGEVLRESIPKVEKILQMYPEDGEIVFQVALILEAIGRLSDALSLLSSSMHELDAKAYAARARLNLRLENKEKARADLLRMLDSPGAELSSFIEAMTYISQLDISLFNKVPDSVALKSLSDEDRLFAGLRFDTDKLQLDIQTRILTGLLATSEDKQLIRNQLALAAVGLGRFDEAIAWLNEVLENGPNISHCFNLAMARWGADRQPTLSLFQRVSELDAVSGRSEQSANYLQCMGITYALLRDKSAALQCLAQAREKIAARQQHEFSAWTYYRVPASQFAEHLRVIEKSITEDSELKPIFMEADKFSSYSAQVH